MPGSAARASDGRSAPGRSVLDGAFALLEAVQEAQEAGLTALAAAGGLPKTTAYRLLEQLVELGAVERHGVNYRMGSRMFRLGREWQPHPGLRAAATGPMQQLAAATGATVVLCVLREGRTLAVSGVPGMVDDVALVQPGATWPWTTAAGKALVAVTPSPAPLGPLPGSWRQEASVIRDSGMALDREALIPGVCCAAVPVTIGRGRAVGALCAMVDPSRDVRRLAHAVERAGRAVDARLRAG
ncbi:helix-turn-helix domain-containing protein [Streptomyces morookaense]|uniref:Helix-turn-helix domain-containing protein n=1 Tax=Streptomyces morookaense TaxID=1970 RepID=A0A7Y7B4P6_STRMO|nr:helix-turn-helix domain-containing protein [Streptomyces morookaense]